MADDESKYGMFPAHVGMTDNLDGTFSLHIKATALALPAGAATEATLLLVKTALEILDNIVAGNEAQVDVVALPSIAQLPAALGAGGGLKVEGVVGGVAQPISAASLPLPAGAATSALQGAGLPAALGAGGGVKVDGSGTALPVSGTFWQATQPVSGTVTAVDSVTGAYTTPTHTAPTAGVASGVILAANVNRLYALFVNDSDTTVYLALGGAAAVNTGIRLNANGGSYEMSAKQGNLYTGVVNGISGVAGKVVLALEGV